MRGTTEQNKKIQFMEIGKSKVLFVTHSLTSSPKEEWLDFLIPRCEKLIYIDHPFSYKKGDIRSSITIFEKGQKISTRYFYFPRKANDICFYIKDFFLNVWWMLFVGKVDLCISLDPLNTFPLILFRKAALIKQLVYYVIDYIPYRFKSNVTNFIYHYVDKMCCYNVDRIWNLSPRMQEGRLKNRVNMKKCAPDIVVPMGVDLSRVNPLPFESIERHTIVYMGAFLEKQGIQLALRVIPQVIKEVPDLKFVIIGVGEYEPEIRKIIKELNIEKYVEMRGYVKDHTEMEKMLCECAIGIATYKIEKSSFSYYADPGKAKVYLGCGLPVIITKFPLVAYEIEEKKAGFSIQYDEIAFKEALLKLLTDDELYLQMRKNAISMSKQYIWHNICAKALEQTGFTI
ncbi:MAG: glycosyltransferase [Candidatus Omnitrophota bacterium]